MSDIFQEIEEDLQREKWDQIWKEYRSWILIGVGTFVIGVAGYLWSGEATERRNAVLSDEYLVASELMAAGDRDAGLAALEGIIANRSGGYVVLAGMQKAALLADEGNIDEAVRSYDAIRSSNKTEDILGQLAAIKAGWLLVETQSYEAMTARLGDLAFAEDEGPWAAGATEILAYSAVHTEKLEEAERLYIRIRTMRSASLGIIGRSAEMLSIIEPQIIRTEPAAELPDAELPDAELPDAELPDAELPAAESNEPQEPAKSASETTDDTSITTTTPPEGE